jgi:hypothetical protein
LFASYLAVGNAQALGSAIKHEQHPLIGNFRPDPNVLAIGKLVEKLIGVTEASAAVSAPTPATATSAGLKLG